MAFFETFRQKNVEGEIVNPATEESLALLRRIFMLLKPLGQVSGGGSNRLSVDVNTVGALSTVNNLNNAAGVGGVAAFDLMKAMSRTGYNSGVRSNLTII